MVVINPAVRSKLIAALGNTDVGSEVFSKVNLAIAETSSAPTLNTAITTIGAGTLTAAGIIGGLITRSGSTAAYTDTTATAALIAAAGATVGMSWILKIKNTVAFAETVTGGTGVTVSGIAIVPALSVGEFLVTLTGATTATVVGIGSEPLCNLPVAQFTTTAAASPVTAAAGDLTGSAHTTFRVETNGAFALTTRTATQMFGDITNCQIGTRYMLTVISQGDDTITITPGTGVTIDTATVATKVARTYFVNFNSATTCVWTTIGKSTVE